VFNIPGAIANSISLAYMQVRVEYFLTMVPNRSVCCLRERCIIIKFVKRHEICNLLLQQDTLAQHPVVLLQLDKKTRVIPAT
jgi:hypothetical protein